MADPFQTHPRRIAIIGVGLIGGSFALAMREAARDISIVGYDRDEVNLAAAKQLGVIDSVVHSLSAAVKDADVIQIAVPVGQIEPVLNEIARHISPTAIITDVGSTKANVIEAAKKSLGTAVQRFVPVHPIAGAEHSGVRSSRKDLFNQKSVVMIETEFTDSLPFEIIKRCWQACGANIETMSVNRHDSVFGVVSHLPHILSFTLVYDIATRVDAETFFHFAASGFRDFTRIAGSNPEMWKDITLANKSTLLLELQRYQDLLRYFQDALESDDGEAIENFFKIARDARRDWSE
ncbi:prephenate dehydrogenase [Ferrovum sp. PN-J185]|uniref:prephenate dehydrogenase n=1 Tax=Ferrovum sp. PN-J185 TaxID=1356306 RepID=UPI00079A47A2|nr:prephenate dehydrogenase/arogenate dehydrogenase family protein [Ferrovum sp. PN-J185]KXW56874.1 ketol-acid reductoisomerase [Ferrovum sp. PN-J185]